MKSYTHLASMLLLGIGLLSSCALRYPERSEHQAQALSDPRAHIALSDYKLGQDSIHASLIDINNGTKVYLWEAKNPRAIVLIQHGILGYAMRYVSEYHNMIPRLLAEGFSVCAIDARSHGYSWGKLATLDVADAISDHLAVRLKLEERGLPIFLYGHSMGGIITAGSLTQRGDKIAGTILLAPALYSPRFAPWGLRFLGTGLSVIAPRLPLLSLGETSTADAKTDKLMPTRTIHAISGTSIYVQAKRASKHYQEVTTPLLLIHGDKDKTTDPESSKRMFREVGSKDKSLMIIRGATHSPLNDKSYQESTLQLILTWLRQRS